MYLVAQEILLLDATDPISDWVDYSDYIYSPGLGDTTCLGILLRHAVYCVTLQKASLNFSFIPTKTAAVFSCSIYLLAR